LDKATWDAKYPGATNGGITLHNSGSTSGWCERIGTYSPCGDHVVTIDLNMYKICGQTDPCDFTKICGGPNPACVVPSDGRYDLVRLLMHEMGHATGLAHHCTDALSNPSDSIMNNGGYIDGTSQLCNPITYYDYPQPGTNTTYAKWTETEQWYSTDRVALYNAYHPTYGQSTEFGTQCVSSAMGPVLKSTT
jgi:hypothetical protein